MSKKFWSEPYPRIAGIIAILVSIFISNSIARETGLNTTGVESSWQQYTAVGLIFLGCLLSILHLIQWVWKSLALKVD